MTSTFHIVIAMKPIEGTFAENALKYGIGGDSGSAARFFHAVEEYEIEETNKES